MTVVVLSEASDQLDPSASARDLLRSTEAARIAGCRVYHIPQDFSACETADNALWHVPEHEVETPAVWIGYIPTPKRYEAIYEAALLCASAVRIRTSQGRILFYYFEVY